MSQPGVDEMGKQVQTTCYHNKVQPSCCLAGYTSYRVIGSLSTLYCHNITIRNTSANIRLSKDYWEQ